MSSDDLNNAINAINFVHQLFQAPISSEEEELSHLLSAAQQRLRKMHKECVELTPTEHK
ncbi:Uncharacterised protein [Enterobacter kobei]|nr:hypothetical protein [Enterobacter hormaechei]VAL43336.1 Uncharacterised protein [Enterobacter kobei]